MIRSTRLLGTVRSAVVGRYARQCSGRVVPIQVERVQWRPQGVMSPTRRGFVAVHSPRTLTRKIFASSSPRAMSTAAGEGYGSSTGPTASASTNASAVAACNDSSPVDGMVATGMAEQAQELAVNMPVELGFGPADLAMRVVEATHVIGDLPYWASIAFVTLVLRTAVFPLGLVTLRNAGRMALMRPEMDLLKAAMESDIDSSQKRRADRYRQEMKALFKKYNCNVVNSFLFPLVQIPLFLSFFSALRSMSETFPEYASGGTLWFTDLGAADPTHTFPILTGLSFLLMAELGADGLSQGNNSAMMRAGMRLIGVIMVPLTWDVSSGVFIYWLTSNAFSLSQVLVLKIPGVKPALGIPVPPAAEESPANARMGWVDIMGASNPIRAYARMQRQRDAERYFGEPVVGEKGGSPLPPPSPTSASATFRRAQKKRFTDSSGGGEQEGSREVKPKVVTYAESPVGSRAQGGGGVKRRRRKGNA
ncbi:unnamed protein product [Discosporangium mesarthrocarpum]